MQEVATLIIGAGVTGIALARALALRGERGIAVIDKEPTVAYHTSGRNSGVAHAGYNQKPGTLKARLCVEGNRRLRALCRERGVPLVEGGILIVAREPAETARLEELLARGRENGVPGLRIVTAKGLEAIEPNARGVAALHAPSGASVDSRAYVHALAEEARSLGVTIVLGTRARQIAALGPGFEVRTAGGDVLRASRLVNCAGLQADQVAHGLGAGSEYGIVPIRGEYRKLRAERAELVRSMIYPVPDLAFPFLGVHWSKTAAGEVLVGPNAVPALGREAYRWRDLAGLPSLALDPRAWRLLFQPGFPRLALSQAHNSLSLRRFAADARSLVPSTRARDLVAGPAGIRAQLVDRKGQLVDDLIVEQQGNALHVLNVVSPGLTCSLAFADEIADKLGTKAA